MNFEKLAQLVDIEVEYIARSSLAIHAGKDTAFEATESPVVKIGSKPVIPGSSLKGVLRSTLEAILAQDGVEVCVPDAAIPNTIRREDQPTYAQRGASGARRRAASTVLAPCAKSLARPPGGKGYPGARCSWTPKCLARQR